MNNPLISVIIPEKTNLSEECSNSLKLQIFEEFEICSSIDAAKGEYIHFINPDSRLSLSLYQKFACIEHKPDIYIFNGSKLGLKTTEPEFVFDIKTWKNISDGSYKHTFLDNANPFNENFCCENKIFRKEFLKSLGDFSIVGLEKQYFFFLTLFNARTIIVNPDAQYYYKDKKTIQKNIFEIFRITDKIKELLNKKNIFEPYKYAFFQYKYKQFALMFMLADENMKEDFYREMQDRLRKYNSENLNPQITERLQHIGMFKNILKLNPQEFYKNYYGKINY